jgi:hypothetical protein
MANFLEQIWYDNDGSRWRFDMRYDLANGYRSLAAILIMSAATISLTGAGGCAGQAATTEPADAALKDPMDYSPDIPKSDMSGTGTMNTKSFDKDMNDLLNP